MARRLTSAGSATSARTELENALARKASPGLARFLTDVRRIIRTEGPEALTTARATELFQTHVAYRIADSLSGLVAQISGGALDALHLSALEERLLSWQLPDLVAATVREVSQEATAAGLSKRAVLTRISKALTQARTEGSYLPGPDGTNRWQGLSWDARLASTVRSEATQGLGWADLDAMAAQGLVAKRWVPRFDSRTRPAHRSAAGQTVPLDGPFIVGGAALMVPGDSNGPMSQTAGCRCVLVGVTAKEFDPES